MSDKSEENLVVTLPPKRSSVIKKHLNQVRFSAFFSSKQFDWCFDNSEPQNHEYEKTHAKISDSVCKDLKTWITIKTQISDSKIIHINSYIPANCNLNALLIYLSTRLF